ncbi:hypothetical protein [Cellulomonas sp. KRMCY2]|uniref:hypothetical protein n=1 Tax=Cellulomonas sp. KRMCY2 TaxID=1304865 RepID=UPI00045E7340|nr:hypothetical protein [Cellulomonas sp. KRMCY2]
MSTDTLPQVDAELPTRRSRARRPHATVLVTVLLLLVVGGVTAVALRPADKADVRVGTALVTADEMAARYGIDVNLIGVTAAGGLIEFRYQVVDPDKAVRMIHDPDLLPVLVIEDTDETLVISTPHHTSELELGGTYFFLLANAHNAVHEGSLVTLVMGDARTEHIAVQG